MAAEKALGLVLRTTDWSESSRIATLWTRELGKVRAVAKGGRRLRSAFESALDLLTVCSIVLLRKSSGGLDLLTEARVVRRFPGPRRDLKALYAAYYVAELLADWTEDGDPHPGLFDEALACLAELGEAGACGADWRPRLLRFEAVLLCELGYAPVLEECAGCAAPAEGGPGLAFSPEAGGVLCRRCQAGRREQRIPLSGPAWEALRRLAAAGEGWRRAEGLGPRVAAELRQVLGATVTYLRGRRPRLLQYLEG
jgi:DNA repair protein RecO (recombination protein O)